MNPFGISDKSYNLIITSFLKYPEVESVIVFGSRAKGNFKSGSDIDLAIKGEHCTEQTAFNLSVFLNEELPIPYHIDIVYYNDLDNKDLKEHIDRVGKLFYSHDTATSVNEAPAVYKTKPQNFIDPQKEDAE